MAEQKLDIKLADLKDDEVIAISVAGKDLALVKSNGRISVLDGKCTHEGGPLGEGYLDNGELICPWHSGAFDITDGKANENTPWVTDTKAYRARVDSATGEIYVEI